MEVAFNDLWESLDNYMGNPLPPFKQFQTNMMYLQSVAKDDHQRQLTLDLEAERYWSEREGEAA
jgi:hypothetical protein